MANSQRTVVTVDGLAASGKSALAQKLAEHLGYVHLNTGLLYRAMGWLMLKEGKPVEDEALQMVVLGQHSFSFGRDHERTAYVQVDGQALSNELASVDVSRAASIVAKNPSLRASLLAIQREAFPGEGMVAEGRDTGTVVFPAAQVKFFVTARLDVRSRRRFDQLAAKGQPAALEEISRELAERDKRDAERETAPMKAASDAVTIDNSDNPLDEIAQRMASHVRERVGKAA